MIRQLLVPVIYNPKFLIHDKLDEAVLRAAHRALVREQSGITDAFLFVLCGELTLEEATTAIAQYGFPDITVICISTKDEDGAEIEDGDVREQIGYAISHWLDKHHPASITNLSVDGYDSLDMWWSGVEATKDYWDFQNDYAATLPDAHRKKAGTWLEILAEVLEIEQPCWSSVNKLSLYAAALCEWLHGFEGASGNSCNGFDADEVFAALQLDDFYLGFLLGQLSSGVSIDEILYNEEIDDLEGIRSHALKQIVEQERTTIRNMLGDYFGSATGAFWALHTAIWPQYTEPSADLCNNIVNSGDWDDLAEHSDAWLFVSDGWTESADE